MNLAAILLLLAGSELMAPNVPARNACADPRGPVVAVTGIPRSTESKEPARILMAAPSESGHWRFRIIDVSAEVGDVAEVRLLRNGMGARFTSNGRERVADLTSSANYLRPSDVKEPNLDDVIAGSVEGGCALWIDGLNKDGRRTLAARWETRYPLEVPVIPDLRWAFYTIDPAERAQFYAPVLQFLDGDVAPSRFEIWDEDPMKDLSVRGFTDKDKEIAEAQRLYRNLKNEAKACSIYYRVDNSHPGVSLYQYWFYYPFDAGAFEDHVHDAEAFFVEVDKLGGRVRRVVGAAHGPWAPSNVYSTIGERSPGVDLPLYAFVEFRKHAMAPDINKDGLFQPGVDTNWFLDKSKVWGIRDAIGSADVNVRGFDASMPVPRSKSQVMVPEGIAKRFGVTGKGTCSLVALTQAPGSVSQKSACKVPTQRGEVALDRATTACATAKVIDHEDAAVPSRVLKGGAFPTVLLRFGVARYPSADAEASWLAPLKTTYTVGIGADVSKVTLGRVALPGRLAFDLLLRERVEYIWDSQDDETAKIVSDRRIEGFPIAGASLRYERQLTPLFGTYLGATWLNDLRRPSDDVFTDPFLEWGLRAERSMGNPSLRDRYSVSAALGFAYNDYFGMTWDLRVGVGLRLLPSVGFGITGGGTSR